MSNHSEAFVGFDTSKLRNAVAIADGGRGGEVRFLGEIDNTEAATAKLVKKLAAKYQRVTFCYEAGPTGYGLYRQIKDDLGHECIVAAPSLIPKRPGDKVKTNRRDAVSLAKLLRAGELTAVFPEGYKGLGKRFEDRYKLQRFGRGGFVTAALRTKAPIIPCSIIGSEEIYPMLTDVKLLARLFGLPYFPVTPLFPLAGPAGLVPLPSKWRIAFGEPIYTSDYAASDAEDPMVTFELTDQVRETIQQTLYRLLAGRRNVFLG